MARSEVVDAVRARLAANWSRTPVFDENSEGSTPVDGSNFLQVQFPFSTNERVSFGAPGANTYREEGAFRLLLNVQRGSGGVTGRQWADELAALFRGKHFDGVETFAPDSASSDDANENGNYFTYAVVVPYRFDYIG
jgi:hypothetical protein